MNKVNYNIKMKNIISELNSKKSLLLHSCCAPCSSAVLERLREYFDITVLYYNPNLDSQREFERRVEEQKRLLGQLNSEIELLIIDYEPEQYYEAIKGHEKDEEGGERCSICFDLRLDKTAKIAKEKNFDFFTTTLSISPHKNSQVLNKIGCEISQKYGIRYLYSDFKKEEGYKRSIELSKEYDLYRQDYCGCIYSKVQKY
ncbi:Hypothetical protein ING2D1G_0494 [Peptoniphilus sp. ING2-D1G]|nr:Hypothetical protein ING2D1G_0494 [Peptoniphilus sp. ING2-D1G]